MSDESSILEIDPSWRRGIEDMGSKPKFWFRYKEEMWLFKRARPNTGEHWAEKVASEIATLLILPTHEVQIAQAEGCMGCAVKSFLKKGEILVHGNELLAGAIKGYDKAKQRGQADHHFDNIVQTMEWFFSDKKVREREYLRIVGYFVFDALVGNTDRHHENWGMVIRSISIPPVEVGADPQMKFQANLAPTFDHGSSLGRELLEDHARRLLVENNAIPRYIRKATGGIFKDAQERKGLSPMALVELIAATYPDLMKPWQNRIAALQDDFAAPLLADIPASCMSEANREFVLAFLRETRKFILSIP